jgi:hypothetical protein
MNKVIGEKTRPTNEPPLCVTCSNALIVKGTRFGDDLTICRSGLGPVRFRVTECSAYDDSRIVPVYRLEETAWRRWGDRFVSPSELYELRRAAAQSGNAADDDEK